MIETLLMLLLIGVIVLPIFLGALVLAVAKKKDEKRINPLTKSLRRPPGGHLSRQLVGLYFDLAAILGLLALPIALSAAIYLFQSHVLHKPDTVIRLTMSGLFAIAILFFSIRKLIHIRNHIQVLRLGYECELAVGQELDQLMRVGFQVFHDIPADNFNIDHLVVGPSGVIVVETKGRSKTRGTAGPEKADYNVKYQNGVLKFPGWQETAPIEQAKLNAQWVSKWLSNATGFTVKAKGIVVLPGWYVRSESTNSIPVLAVGAIPSFFKKYRKQALSEQQITQIVYQVEQRSMNLKPGDSLRPLEGT
jgi:hypothetical protein